MLSRWGLAVVVFIVVTGGLLAGTLVLYHAEDDREGFWHSSVPAFYANLAAVGIAVAAGIPAALAANRFWARHQAEMEARQRRADAVRVLQSVRNEVAQIQGSVGFIPSQLDSTRTTGSLHYLQVQSLRLGVTAWEELDRGDYLNLAKEHGLDRVLTMLYQQVATVNGLIDQWTNVGTQSRPEERDSNLQGLTPMVRFYCDNTSAQATAMLGEIDRVLGRLQQGPGGG